MTDNRNPASDIRAQVVARNVKAECIRRGYDPAEWVATTLGKSTSTARRKLSGALGISVTELTILADALGVTTDSLVKEAS